MTAPELERPLTERFYLDWAKCGTEANEKAHRRRGETPCDACLEAVRIVSLERKNRKRRIHGRSIMSPFPERLHGTISGETAHRERGELPCQECRDARNEYRRKLYRKHVGA